MAAVNEGIGDYVGSRASETPTNPLHSGGSPLPLLVSNDGVSIPRIQND
jgi:hypothetical protein